MVRHSGRIVIRKQSSGRFGCSRQPHGLIRVEFRGKGGMSRPCRRGHKQKQADTGYQAE